LDDDHDSGKTKAAEQKMLAVVDHVAIKGSSLLSSKEYGELKKQGFFISSINWIAEQMNAPNERIEFEASFEEPREGKRFKYYVRGVYKLKANGVHIKNHTTVPQDQQEPLMTMIEKTSRTVLADLLATGAGAVTAPTAKTMSKLGGKAKSKL
jgi:hypothetical protein